ncbi:hypothetical protein BD413DRAFT_121289 [Trametes elegans]|nr:hypothetical protein BD413DRAFT_121289 [Trametes elegans]
MRVLWSAWPGQARAFLLATTTLLAGAREITVDDNDPAIVYSPANQWSQGATCGSSCSLHPEPLDAYDGTWHDTTYFSAEAPRTITYSFSGTRVQVFNILPEVGTSALSTNTDLTFSVDGVTKDDGFQRSAGASYVYNALVFDSGTLDNHAHTLIIQATLGTDSVILFDKLVYTVPDPVQSTLTSAQSPSDTSTSSTTTSTSTTHASPSTSSSSLTSLDSLLSTSTLATVPAVTLVSLTAAPSITDSGASPLRSGETSAGRHVSSGSTAAGLGESSQGTVSTLSWGESVAIVTVSATPQAQGSSSGNGVPTGVVIGSAVGGSIIVFILLAALIYILCARRARRHPPSIAIDEEVKRYSEAARDLYPSHSTWSRAVGTEQNPFLDPRPTLPPNPVLHIARFADTDEPVAGSDQSTRPASPTSTRSTSQSMVTASETPHPSLLPSPSSISAPSPEHDIEEKVSTTGAHENVAIPRLPVGRAALAPEDGVPRAADARMLEELAALQQEVARIRVNQESQWFVEPLPRYGDA